MVSQLNQDYSVYINLLFLVVKISVPSVLYTISVRSGVMAQIDAVRFHKYRFLQSY